MIMERDLAFEFSHNELHILHVALKTMIYHMSEKPDLMFWEHEEGVIFKNDVNNLAIKLGIQGDIVAKLLRHEKIIIHS
jgi:hypothetical protein